MPSARSLDLFSVGDVGSPSGLGGYGQWLVLDHLEAVPVPKTNNPYRLNFGHGSFSGVNQLVLKTRMEALRLLDANTLWQQHVFNPTASADIDSLTETVEGILNFIAEFGPSCISLNGFQPLAVQGEHLATLLRASSTWRDEIEGWDNALDVAKEALIRENINPADALFGMI